MRVIMAGLGDIARKAVLPVLAATPVKQDEVGTDIYAQQAAQAAAAPAPAPVPEGGQDDMIDQLKQLADLKASGVLSDEEFAALDKAAKG